METAVQERDNATPANRRDFVFEDKKHPDGPGNLLWYQLTHWEAWDWRIKYLLILPAWIWFCLRARSLWFFCTANPDITFGGFDGDRKSEAYKLLPPGTYPKCVFISPSCSVDQIVQQITAAQLHFPLAAKPDVGKMGLMFRKIHSMECLIRYHQKMFCDYILQEWVDYPMEVSIFYHRTPGAVKGHITGFVKKEFLEVLGDGRSSLEELILRHPRARLRVREMQAKHHNKLSAVLSPGERYCLSPALNLSRGGKLVSLEHEKDERLLNVFDAISCHAKHFYFGRYDVKCSSIEDLKLGKNFSILEYNGSGAEPHHVYGNGNSLWKACSVLVAHWNILYQIARANQKAGIPYWGLKEGLQFLLHARRHMRALKRLDRETILDEF